MLMRSFGVALGLACAPLAFAAETVADGPRPHYQAAVSIESDSQYVGLQLAGQEAIAWLIGDTTEYWEWDRSDASGQQVCFLSNAKSVCQTVKTGEVSVFVIKFAGRDNVVLIGLTKP